MDVFTLHGVGAFGAVRAELAAVIDRVVRYLQHELDLEVPTTMSYVVANSLDQATEKSGMHSRVARATRSTKAMGTSFGGGGWRRIKFLRVRVTSLQASRARPEMHWHPYLMHVQRSNHPCHHIWR